jgi:hypothetical protein
MRGIAYPKKAMNTNSRDERTARLISAEKLQKVTKASTECLGYNLMRASNATSTRLI